MDEPQGSFEKKISYLQQVVPLGYLFLLVNGFVVDSIIYSNLGIDILHYSSVFDLLVSPIAILTADFENFVVLVVLIVGFLGLTSWLSKKYGDRAWYKKMSPQYTWEIGHSTTLLLSALMFLVAYSAGIASGRAAALEGKIKEKTYRLTHQITFRDNDELKVMIVGQNTQYIFYVPEGTSDITVSPVLTNIKKIVEL